MSINGPTPPGKRWSVQSVPNLISSEKRLCLTRVCWNRGTPGMGAPYHCSFKASISLCYCLWHKAHFGVVVEPELWGFVAYIGLIPFFPIRLHFKRAYGGSFV